MDVIVHPSGELADRPPTVQGLEHRQGQGRAPLLGIQQRNDGVQCGGRDQVSSERGGSGSHESSGSAGDPPRVLSTG